MTFRSITLLLLLALTVAPVNAQLTWNQAATFAGTASSYVAIPNSTELNITGSFTIECWVKPDSVDLFRMLVNHRAGAASEGYGFYLSQGSIAIRTNSTTRFRTASTIPPHVWSHIAVTYDVSTGNFSAYINGSLDSSATIASAAPSASSDSVTIGVGFNSPFRGVLDEVRIWNRAVTAPEIARNFRTSLGATGGFYSGLVLALTFQDDESFGADFSLTDWSGNGNTGYNRGVTAVDLNDIPPDYVSLNEAVDLNGTSGYLSGPDNSSVSPTTAVTMEAWILPRVYSSAVIIQKGTSGGGTNYRLRFNGGLLGAAINGDFTFTANAGTVPLNVWTHVAFTYDGATGAYAFYVNGNLTNTATNAVGNITDGADSLCIGGAPGFTTFDGLIDEVRISGWVKSAEDIRKFVYVAIDDANEPNSGQTNVCYALDGVMTDQCADGGPRLYFNGDARLSNPATVSNVGVSPLGRAAQIGFLTGFTMKTSDRRIPETGSSGTMTPDSIYIGQNTSISDINLFVALNHTYDGDIDLTITGPGGATVDVCSDWFMGGQDDNIVTLFDDNADSAYADGTITSPGPHIKPENPLNSVFTGTSAQGWWILRITDDAGGDTGRVYAWGIQINNQATVTDVHDMVGQPFEYTLDQNYPNPFNPVTTIAYSIGSKGPVTLEIYDLLGRRVATLVNEEKPPGQYRASFDARAVASGTYFYRLTSRDFVQVRKMLLLR
jgi:subtilisin-like proprotein convertase family protein